MKKVIDLIAQWAVVISGGFVFIGILRAILYYLPFKIPIHTYIDLSEVFTIWFPDTIFSLFGIFVILILVLFTRYVPEERKIEYYYYHAVVYLFHLASLFFLYTDLLFNIYGRHSGEKHEFIRPFWLLISLLSIFGATAMVGGVYRLIQSEKKQATPFQKQIVRTDIFINVALVSFYVFWYFVYEPLATEIASPVASTRIELVNDKGKISSSNSLRYIGKTRNYIFLWDKRTKASSILPVDQFTEIRIIHNMQYPGRQ